MDERYGQFLNGMSKFERMLRDPDPKYSKMVTKYWFTLLKELKGLKLDRSCPENGMLMKLKHKMMVAFDWAYHPKYFPQGRRDENSDRLDERHKRLQGFY